MATPKTSVSAVRDRGGETWNTKRAIEHHRSLTPAERLSLAIELSRAALAFAAAGRRDGG